MMASPRSPDCRPDQPRACCQKSATAAGSVLSMTIPLKVRVMPFMVHEGSDSPRTPLADPPNSRQSRRMPTAGAPPASFEGDVLVPDSPEYDDARTVWNGAVDRRPKYVVRCAGTDDVRAAVRVARELGL